MATTAPFQIYSNPSLISLPSCNGFFLSLLFDFEDGRDMFLRNAGISELHGVVTKKTALFIVTVVGTSNTVAL
jgi:hypothetical protein